MFSTKRTALYIAIGALAFAANDAAAIVTCKTLSGMKICKDWTVASAFCDVTAQPATATDLVDPQLTCTIWGAELVAQEEGPAQWQCNGELPPGTLVCEEPSYEAAALRTQTLVTQSLTAAADKNSNANGNGWAGTNPARQGPKCNPNKPLKPGETCSITDPDDIAYVFPGYDSFSASGTMGCIGSGAEQTCSLGLEILPPDNFCGGGDAKAVDFTPDKFIGEVRVTSNLGTADVFSICTRKGTKYDCTDLEYEPNYCGGE